MKTATNVSVGKAATQSQDGPLQPPGPTSPLDISVVVPTLNEATHVQRSVQSAIAAGAKEVIVADGGSDDDTVRIASEAGARTIASSRGRGTQQNAGAAIASGEWLVFLHADNWLGEQALLPIDRVASDCQCGAFHQQIDNSRITYRAIELGNFVRARFLRTPYGDQGIFVRRSMFEQVGGFPNEPLMEDVLLMRKLRPFGRPTILPGPIHVDARRWERTGVATQTLRNWLLITLLYCGASPTRLARFYSPHKESAS